MNATLRIIGYLKGTVGVGVSFQKGINLEIEAYTNVDWEGNLNCRRSTLVGGNLVTWRNKNKKWLFSQVQRRNSEVLFEGYMNPMDQKAIK